MIQKGTHQRPGGRPTHRNPVIIDSKSRHEIQGGREHQDTAAERIHPIDEEKATAAPVEATRSMVVELAEVAQGAAM